MKQCLVHTTLFTQSKVEVKMDWDESPYMVHNFTNNPSPVLLYCTTRSNSYQREFSSRYALGAEPN